MDETLLSLRSDTGAPARAAVALALVLGAPFVVGCGKTNDAAAVSVTDSVGIRIVHSVRPRLGSDEGWRVSGAPNLRIGAAVGNPDYTLFNVRSVLRLADGRIVVANQGTDQIRFYDASGRLETAVGGAGNGPGEFEYLDAVWLGSGDSLFASDRASNRVTVYGSDGTLARSFNVSVGAGLSRPFKLGVLADGSLVASTISADPAPGPDGVVRSRVRYLRYSAVGEPIGEVTEQPYLERFVTQVDGSQAFIMIPFSQAPVLAIGRSRVFVGPPARYELLAFAADGTLDTVLRRAHEPVPLGGAERAAHRAEVLASYGEGMRGPVGSLLDVVPYPPSLPAMASALVDDLAYLWVREHTFPEPVDARWSVFAPDGVWETDVTLPTAFEPTHVGADFVLGVLEDELEVEYVVEYALERGSADPDSRAGGER